MKITRRSFVKKSSYSAAAISVLGVGTAFGEETSGKKHVLAYEYFSVEPGESITFTSPGSSPPTVREQVIAEDEGMTLVHSKLLDGTFGTKTREQWGWVASENEPVNMWTDFSATPEFNLAYLGNNEWRITPGGFSVTYVHYWLL